ncbi:MAG TPA: formylmethanofuran dehydrogenase subunit A, partial [Roseiarcus sp.]|nr:formylmethanofuran dehydrogenase subunit A [Roseiarcus sp.]
LGNDDFVLDLMRAGEGASALSDHVAWVLETTRALGIKVINAGGVAAFKENVRQFDFDDVAPHYGVSSRSIVKALQQAVHEAGVPHPLHVHCNNLGMPGNFTTALATIAAAEDLPLHLAHLQFYGYGAEGKHGVSSGAPQLAEAVNATNNVTVDVGQAMFGQTVTISSDVIRQFAARGFAHPKKYAIIDGDANGGGIVPFEYKAGSFFNAMQFAVGLELFLLIDDPWRVFFTTDHPNGAPFTLYPELFALLMDRDLRAERLASIPAEAAAMTTLPSLTREYTLYEIATMTRAAPARLLGLSDRGRLDVGGRADVALYRPGKDLAAMFRSAARVYKDGDLVVRDGAVTHYRFGRALHVSPPADAAIRRRMERYYDERYGLPSDFMRVPAGAIPRAEPFEDVACAR